jgi:hypothetical protein
MYDRGVGDALLALKFGRRKRILARAVLWPIFLARTGYGAWRRSAGKARVPTRAAWVALEAVGRAAFVAGSVRGLLAARADSR